MEILGVQLPELERYLKLYKQKGALTLSTLGKLQPEINAVIGTEVGRELLEGDVKRVEEILMKMCNGGVTDMELAEIKYLKDIRIPYITGKIKKYLEGIQEIKKVGK